MSINRTRRLTVTLIVTSCFGLAVVGQTQFASASPTYGRITAADEAAVPVQAELDPAQPPEGAEEPAPEFTTLAAAYGGTVTRGTVMKRARNWYSRNVQYSQSAYAWDINKGKKYRTDCSGFVSMSLRLTTSRTTRTLGAVSTRISWSNLRQGDMVLHEGRHVQLFDTWANSGHSKMWIYEEGSTASDMNHRVISVSTAKANSYLPWRYNKIK